MTGIATSIRDRSAVSDRSRFTATHDGRVFKLRGRGSGAGASVRDVTRATRCLDCENFQGQRRRARRSRRRIAPSARRGRSGSRFSSNLIVMTVDHVAALARDASMSSSYKPALLKALVRLVRGGAQAPFSLLQIGHEFVDLYWVQTVVFRIRQAATISAESEVVRRIRSASDFSGVRRLSELPNDTRRRLDREMARVLTINVLCSIAFIGARRSACVASKTGAQATIASQPVATRSPSCGRAGTRSRRSQTIGGRDTLSASICLRR